ncbi:hypothetical protein [Sinanaerobacter sp. ZZT-01]|uniref:hypothetical protein n=1 Tax=Sinanaerobacter sp. ZZT-01 TaxID=3111540 RepID=UPI002D777520|nr:hypothetical protein [Sinanaerobacter sp. ZZT-01]WRR94526.1 hypothetical protein U5921_05260 [Sinanaerobacter sp. ZZT-01]
MNRNDLKVIQGGASNAVTVGEHKFISAYVTDTRLMGVIGLHIHWAIESPSLFSDFHQFFYFDAEEFGLETYRSVVGNESFEITLIEKTLIDGLGGEKKNLNEREARYLVQQFVKTTFALNTTPCEPQSEYAFLLEDPIILNAEELNAIADKLCTSMKSHHQVIHYYLMRTFGRDIEGASYLLSKNAQIEEISEKQPSTLCRNTIEEFLNPDGSLSYLSESLIEVENSYKIVLSELKLENEKVCFAKKRSSFSVSPAEVAMLLNRPEFVTLFEILVDPDEFESEFSHFSAGAMQTIHDNGRLYLEFNHNNDHVIRQTFRLNEDVHGLYYISDYGQLVIAAYTKDDIRDLENRLHKSGINLMIIPTAKYEFKEPVLYEFIQSDFDDFNEFIESLQ